VSEKEVRRNVEKVELAGEAGMAVVDLLREVGSHPGVDERVRREVEIREFGFWRRLVGCLRYILCSYRRENGHADCTSADAKATAAPAGTLQSKSMSADPPRPALFNAPTHPAITREDARSHVDGLAKGFVLLGIGGDGAEEGWSWVIEGKDEPTLCASDSLHRY
jgi:superkiller protein 3